MHVSSWSSDSALQMEQLLGQTAAAGPEEVVLIAADLNCDHLEPEAPQSPYGYMAADVARPL